MRLTCLRCRRPYAAGRFASPGLCGPCLAVPPATRGPLDELVPVEVASHLYGVHVDELARWVRVGLLPVHPGGLVDCDRHVPALICDRPAA